MIPKPMTHKKFALMAIPALAAIMFSAGISTSFADSENSAEVIIDFADGCFVFDPDGGIIAADTGHWMQNKNNGKATCEALNVLNPSGEDLRIEGNCSMINGKFGTYDGTFFNQISDNGDGTADIVFQCHTKAS